MKKIIIINGKGGVGKDTLCDFAAYHFPVMNISSITPIKELARECGWKGTKTEKDRKFLSDLKTLVVDFNDLPNLILLERTEFFLTSSKKEIMFVHIRESSEIEKYKQSVKDTFDFDCETLLVKRSAIEQSLGNASDDNVEDYNYDYVYFNEKSLEKAEDDFIGFIKEAIMGGNFVTRLAVETPKGFLIATPTEDKEYPGIKIELVDKDGKSTLLSLVEHNGTTGELRNVFWSMDDNVDEPFGMINFTKGE